MAKFKPQLLPNNNKGEVVDILNLPNPIEDYCVSLKEEGGRILLMYNGQAVGRSLKPIRSLHIQEMAKNFSLLTQHNGVVEAEFFSPNMNFAEVMHFFRCTDVTADKEIKKLQRLWDRTKGDTVWILNGVEHLKGSLDGDERDAAVKWAFPGRTVEWLTTWHPCLRFYIFDQLNGVDDTRTKSERYDDLLDFFQPIWGSDLDELCTVIVQRTGLCADEVFQMYDQAQMDNHEGLVLIYKYAKYKFGRFTSKSGNAYKLKEDDLMYDGLIVAVEESTIAIAGAPKTTNKLGRSVTSKLKEHREPSGMASGFRVLLDDGQKMSVSLSGFSHPDRIKMLQEPLKWIGETIRFTAMAPVKVGGKPRGPAHFMKGDIRDGK